MYCSTGEERYERNDDESVLQRDVGVITKWRTLGKKVVRKIGTPCEMGVDSKYLKTS